MAGDTVWILLARDEACSGSLSRLRLLIWVWRSGPPLGLPETGEALEQWCGRRGSGANGMDAVPAPADWKLKTRYTTLIALLAGDGRDVAVAAGVIGV